jgi:hypothetical protein
MQGQKFHSSVYTKNWFGGKILLRPGQERFTAAGDRRFTLLKRFPRTLKSDMIFCGKETLAGILAGCRENW